MITKEGFDFSFQPEGCQECKGACCRGESGYIWITPKEIERAAELIGVEFDDFSSRFVKKVNYRYSLVEKRLEAGDVGCIFFDERSCSCTIYDARPSQCRSFPFWESFKNDSSEVFKECPWVKPI